MTAYMSKSYAKEKEKDNKNIQRKRLSPYESMAKPNNTGIPAQMKNGFESMSGLSFDDVNVHYNSGKPAQLNAHAYTQGNDVHIAPGQEKHLAHELGHVVQQKQGRVQPTAQLQDVNINDDETLESEADKMGDSVQMMSEDELLAEEEEPPLQMRSSGNGVVQRATLEATKKNQQIATGEGIRNILEDFTSGIWVFPNQASGSGLDGCVGNLCVSICHTVKPEGANGYVAVHQTFSIEDIFIPSISGLSRKPNPAKPRINAKNLHVTARTEEDQKKCSAIGTADESVSCKSIHRSKDFDWIRTSNKTQSQNLIKNLGYKNFESDKVHLLDAINRFGTDNSDNLKSVLSQKLSDSIRINGRPYRGGDSPYTGEVEFNLKDS